MNDDDDADAHDARSGDDNLCEESVISYTTHTQPPTRLTRGNVLLAGAYLHPGISAPSGGQPRIKLEPSSA